MAIYTKLNKAQISELLKNYPTLVDRDFTARGIGMGTVNTYYKLVFGRGATRRAQVYYLKIDEIGDKKRLKNEITIFKNLKRHEKKLKFAFTYPINGRSNKLFFPLGEKFILLFKEIPGRSIYRGFTPKHLYQVGQLLKQLHKIPVDKNVKPHRFNLKGMKDVFNEIHKPLKQKHPDIEKFITTTLSSLKTKNKEQRTKNVLIHADIFPENLFWHGNKLYGLIDYEAAGSGEPLFDICVAVHALCHDGKKFCVDLIQALLKGYDVERQQRNKDYLFYFLELTALRFLLTRLRDFEFKGASPKAENFKDYRVYLRRFNEIHMLVNTHTTLFE